MELAFSFTSGLKSSAMSSQGMGPKPIEKVKMKMQRLASGSQEMDLATSGLCDWM